jgi:hypothetical protein
MGAPYLPAFGRCGIPRTLPLTVPGGESMTAKFGGFCGFL